MTHAIPSPPIGFIISAPRSGSTMLERILESHSQILGGPEPHLMTPLAHLGVWANVDKAPYDHILAAEAQKGFVERLPRGEQDYWDACRAYADVLYGRYLSTSAKTVCIDKTPAYALVLPFLEKVYPDARYVVLTRHPAAIWSSYANSFFDGDFQTALDYNPIINRYVPAMARFLGTTTTAHVHVRYEDLVADPEQEIARVYDLLEVPYEAETIAYGSRKADTGSAKNLGDPIGVGQHDRPTTDSVNKWAGELAADGDKRTLVENMMSRIEPDDLATFGYPIETFWEPLEQAGATPPPPPRLSRYRIQRKLIMTLRKRAQRGGLFRRTLQMVRLAADVLLRE